MVDMVPVDFDSQLLNTPVSKLVLNDPIQNRDLEEVMRKTNSGIVYCFTPVNNSYCRVLSKNGFALVSIRQKFNMPMDLKMKITLPEKHEFVDLTDITLNITSQDMGTLAEVICKTSRYYKDPKIGKNKALTIYDKWISNSRFESYADNIIGLMHNDLLVGLISTKIIKDQQSIDLIGVREDHQGQGLGRLLVSKMNNMFYGSLKSMQVITEGENVQAVRFYEKIGFRSQQVELVYHKHNT